VASDLVEQEDNTPLFSFVFIKLTKINLSINLHDTTLQVFVIVVVSLAVAQFVNLAGDL